MAKIKNKLGLVLEERGISASWLAIWCKVQRSTISNIVNGNYSPSFILAMRISKTLGMSIHDIFFLEEDD